MGRLKHHTGISLRDINQLVGGVPWQDCSYLYILLFCFLSCTCYAISCTVYSSLLTFNDLSIIIQLYVTFNLLAINGSRRGSSYSVARSPCC